jgi:threonine dehydrogenase-like Zn-dependent dehydrogenase
VQIAKAYGAGQVIAVGTPLDKNRLELACWMGADAVVIAEKEIDPAEQVRNLTSGRGVDLVIEFAGTAEAGRHSLEMAR